MVALKGCIIASLFAAAAAQTRCSDETAPPIAEYVMYNQSTHTVSASCSSATFGTKVADSCCSEDGAMLPAMVGKTFTQIYQDGGNSNCPLLLPAYGMHAHLQCNTDGTITYGEQCTSNCTPCDTVMTMTAGCYRVGDLPGTNWFVRSRGCACTPATKDPKCACLYDTGLPEEFWKGGKYENHSMISQYGGVCAAWDAVPNTPWHSDYCAGKDYCTESSWCDDAWCYVDPSCPSWTETSVFADVPGAPGNLGYSYERCGSKNCFTDANAMGCPDDPLGACPDPCECLYAEHGLPAGLLSDETLPMLSQYGATCAAWDSVPGTPWYSGYCNSTAGKDYCHRDTSWCAAPWCYVSKKCPSWVKTSVFKDVEGAPPDMGYSYLKCDAPDCYSDKNAKGCPYDWNGACCQCKYSAGLDKAFYEGGKFESMPMISGYGTTCAAWDSVPGTPWYSYCDTAKGVDHCSMSSSWCNDPWCYVDKDTCSSWTPTSVFEDVPGAPETLGYSYEMCGALNCYGTDNKDCPYDPHGECVETMEMTCRDVKKQYKGAKCCDAPDKKMQMKR